VQLPGHEVQIGYVFSDNLTDLSLLAGYQALLSPDEQARCRRFHFARDRHQFLVARVLARTLLSRYVAVRPEEWTFATNAYGRPEIAGPDCAPPLRFNLSHTAGLVACAVAWDREVGVDVENTTRPGGYTDLARRFFAPSEAAHIESLPAGNQQETFFAYWTLKESYIKARGLGLALPLADFAFRLEAGQSVQITFAGSIEDDPSSWWFEQFRPSAHHHMALAVRRRQGERIDVISTEVVPSL
jgi:4'-phosphopantetheinyl transferase